MENKIGFKKTELGYIPKDWKVAKVKDMYELNSNQITSSNTPFDEFYYIDLSSVKSGVVTVPNEKIKLDEAPSRAKRILEQNDVIISTVRPNLKGFAIADFKVDSMVCSTGFALIKSKDVLDGKYLLHNLFSHSISNQIENLVVGSNYPAINTSDVLNLIIPCPPLPEQQKIATILSKWDELIETQTQLIEEKEKQKKGLMQKLLTGELRFPGFEEEWEEVRLGDICKTFSGGTPRRNRKEYYNGDIPWIKSGELNSPNIYSTEENITELGLKNSSAKLVPANTVLLAMYGATAGVISITRIEATVNQAILVIQPNENLNYLFLFYYLKFVMPFELQRLIQGGQPNLSADIVKSIKLAIPSISEQSKITSFLVKCDHEIQSLKDKLESIKLQKKGLMQQLLTGKIRVKI